MNEIEVQIKGTKKQEKILLWKTLAFRTFSSSRV